MKNLTIILLFIVCRFSPLISQNNICLNNQTDIGGMFSWVLSSNGYASGDLNNDNKIDFILPSNNSNSLALALSTSSNTYAPLITFTVDYIVANVAADDFNNDGNCDIAFSCSDSNKVVVLNGNGLGTFTSSTKYNILFPGGNGIICADLNNDGAKDFTVGTYNNFYVFTNNGSGGFNSLAYAFVGPILLEDLNNDNFKDIYIAGTPNSVFLKNTGFGNFLLQNTTTLNASSSFDANNDGLKDLIGINSYSLFVSLNTGNFNFSNPVLYNIPLQFPFLANKADLNGDGFLDIIVPDGGYGKFSIHLNNGNGNFLAPVIYTTNPQIILIESIQTKDLDNNGRTDIVVRCNNSGLTLFYNCITTDMKEMITYDEGTKITPNPSSNIFKIKTDKEILSIEVIDFCGKSILRYHQSDQIDLSNYSNGIYFLKIETVNGEIGNYKLIKTD